MNPSQHPPTTGENRPTTPLTWLAHRRRTALTHILRGACYGLGTGVIGLLFLWAEKYLL